MIGRLTDWLQNLNLFKDQQFLRWLWDIFFHLFLDLALVISVHSIPVLPSYLYLSILTFSRGCETCQLYERQPIYQHLYSEGSGNRHASLRNLSCHHISRSKVIIWSSHYPKCKVKYPVYTLLIVCLVGVYLDLCFALVMDPRILKHLVF